MDDAAGMSAWQLGAVGFLLLVAWLSSVWCGLSAPAGSPPDESHHAAVVRHLIEDPLDFPLTYHRIFTNGEPNHLGHPPLFYALAAAWWHLSHFGDVPTSDVQLIGQVRPVAWLLVLAGYVGVLVLLQRCCLLGWLRPRWALVFVAITAFVPSSNFVGGVLNNDVMAFVVWPWLTLAFVGWRTTEQRKGFWQALIWVGVAVLSKSTLWPLAFASFGWLMTDWRRLLQWRAAGWWRLALLALLAVGCVVQLSSNVVRYGALQPDLAQIYGMPPEQTDFFQANAVRGWAMPLLVAATMAHDGVVTTRGVLTHHEKLHPSYPKAWALVLALAAAWLSLRVWFAATRMPAGPVIRFALLTCGVFALALYCMNLATYWTYNFVASMGRYAVAYGPLAVLAWCMGVCGKSTGRSWAWWFDRVAVVLVGLALCSPFFYQRQASYDRAGAVWLATQRAALLEAGYQPLRVINPDDYDRFIKLPGSLVFDGEDEMAFPLELKEPVTSLEWVVLVKGDAGADLLFSLYGSQFNGTTGERRLAEYETEPGLQEYRLIETGFVSGSIRFEIRLKQHLRDDGLPVLRRFWPQTYDPEVLGVHLRFRPLKTEPITP